MQKMGIAIPAHPVVSHIPLEDDFVLRLEDPLIFWLGTSLQQLADHLAAGLAASTGDDTHSRSARI